MSTGTLFNKVFVAYFHVPWWRHQMETFFALLVICAGIHRSPVNSLHKGQWRGALMFSWSAPKRLSKQWWGWLFETPSCLLWRHRNAIAVICLTHNWIHVDDDKIYRKCYSILHLMCSELFKVGYVNMCLVFVYLSRGACERLDVFLWAHVYFVG